MINSYEVCEKICDAMNKLQTSEGIKRKDEIKAHLLLTIPATWVLGAIAAEPDLRDRYHLNGAIVYNLDYTENANQVELGLFEKVLAYSHPSKENPNG